MAAMRPIKALGVLGLSPLLQSSACIVAPFSSKLDLHKQCLPFSTSASSDSFSYRIAASFSAKGHRFNPKTDLTSFKPRNDKVRSLKSQRTQRPHSGQDSFFITNIGDTTNMAFGVADGVGGWIDSGIDSAHFSHGICEAMAMEAQKHDFSVDKFIYAGELLQKGYDKMTADTSIRGGGTTACVAVGGSDGSLEVANLGDSGFVQLRPNAVYYSSKPQTHAFNTPYQLSIIPPQILARSMMFGGGPLHDYPKDANITNHQVKHGDILVFATDGVWDNLSSADLLKLMSHHMTRVDAWRSSQNGLIASSQLKQLTESAGIAKEQGNSIQAILAVAIASTAKMASTNTKVDGPFAKEVRKYYPHENYHGGKVDDICVVVAVVVDEQLGLNG